MQVVLVELRDQVQRLRGPASADALDPYVFYARYQAWFFRAFTSKHTPVTVWLLSRRCVSVSVRSSAENLRG